MYHKVVNIQQKHGLVDIITYSLEEGFAKAAR